MTETWQAFSNYQHKLKQVGEINGLLSWDQEVLMPKDGISQRADQMSYMEGHLHELKTNPQYRDLVEKLVSQKSKLEAWQQRSVELAHKELNEASKLPATLVEEIARETVKSQEVWKAARSKSDFKIFQPNLQRMIDLALQKANCLKEAGQKPYEVCLDHFELGVKLQDAQKLLEDLRSKLVPTVQEILEKMKSQPKSNPGLFKMSTSDQKAFNQKVIEWMGFELNSGRLDPSTHPFCSGTAFDVRLTTRFDESDWCSSLYSVMHEAGHGIYEQALGRFVKWKELQTAASYGFHESQSRFWENLIGRSRAYCERLTAKMKEWNVPYSGSSEELYHWVNRVQPSLIRVESDEVTYNLHILVRFELEQALFEGNLKVADLPEAWNQKYKSYLGIDVPNDAQGVLQDIHWSLGLIGYFPTYSFGNLISVQLLEAMNKSFNVDKSVASGDLQSLKKWLNENVHSQGCLKPTWTLVRDVTGMEPQAAPFVSYLRKKFL